MIRVINVDGVTTRPSSPRIKLRIIIGIIIGQHQLSQN